jgi:hypothetical protein
LAALNEGEEVIGSTRGMVLIDLEDKITKLGSVTRKSEVDTGVALAGVVIQSSEGTLAKE